MKSVQEATISIEYPYRVRFTTNVFHPDNTLLSDLVRTSAGTVRAQVFVDQALMSARTQLERDIADYADTHRSDIQLESIRQVPGGEVCKTDRAVLDSILKDICNAALCRHSYVIAVGGGAVLDVVGLAAALAHRGVRLIRLPTTTLSQADSGVAVKNGINAFGKKNYLGTFNVPWAVINDTRFLTTLSDRDWRCGFSESVKVALMKDKALFEQIASGACSLRERNWDQAMPIIQRSCALHLEHIAEGGDPFELHQARPLDFGHWAAHKLEELTNFGLKHGEAVAIGIAIDVVYSALIGYLSWDVVESILTCLSKLGFDLHHETMRDHSSLLLGLADFQEHLGGPLTIPLLKGIGESVCVHEIDHRRMVEALKHLESKYSLS